MSCKTKTIIKKINTFAETFNKEGYLRENYKIAPRFLNKEWRRQNTKKTAFLYSTLSGATAYALNRFVLRENFRKFLDEKEIAWLEPAKYLLYTAPVYFFKKMFSWQSPKIENGQVTSEQIMKNWKNSEYNKITKKLNAAKTKFSNLANQNCNGNYTGYNNKATQTSSLVIEQQQPTKKQTKH